uniref:Gag polyprotein n=1 Tax=Bactrocera dorsalis TaxID=27457 RepID=A0A034VRB3_BACDO
MTTLKELRSKCRNAGLPTSGTKVQLAQRLDDHVNKENESDSVYNETMTQRLSALEKTIERLVSVHELQNNMQNTPCASNFQPTFMSSPERTMYTSATNVQYTTTPATRVNFMPQHIPIISDGRLPIGNNIPISNSSHYSMRDIVELLPEYNPTSETSLNSVQFIKRIEILKNAYNWPEQILICAVQQKLRGCAKLWIDSQQCVFVNWTQFVNKFLTDFPCMLNEADTHIKLSRTKRFQTESPVEYFYRMLALGNKGGLTEASIARHIVNGVNDNDLKRKISNEYNRCQDLLKDIMNYSVYNDTNLSSKSRNASYTVKPQTLNSKNIPLSVNNCIQRSFNETKCYNCAKFGHYAINCPEPQKKPRCSKCQRTTHKTDECPEKKNVKVNKISNNTCKAHKPNANNVHKESGNEGIVKIICVNGHDTNAFVAPLFAKYSLRKSVT